ncbi:MAG: ABC transporter permease subunit [Micromonosporaceae bacterium]|nr:ABC transporter permease subunit [Micromonosporaceae bacterium]
MTTRTTTTGTTTGTTTTGTRFSTRRWLRWAPFLLAALALVFLYAPPVVSLVVGSLRRGTLVTGTDWSLSAYPEVIGRLLEGGITGTAGATILYGGGSAVVALLIGGALAFITTRTNAPLRSLGYVTATGLIAIPALVYAICWQLLLGRGGVLQSPLERFLELFGVQDFVLSINNLAGMIWVDGANYAALAFFLLVGPMQSVDRNLEEAALTSGASGWQLLRRVLLPLMLPSVLAVLLLTGVRTLESFSVPVIIGVPGGVTVMTTEIWLSTQRLPPDESIATAHSVLLVLLVVGFLWLYARASSNAARYQTVRGRGHLPRTVRLGGGRFVLLGLQLAAFLTLVVLPLAVVVWASVQPFYAGLDFTGFTLSHYGGLLEYDGLRRSMVNSVVTAVVAAALIMLIASALSWIGLRLATGGQRRALTLLGSFALALPGLVIGLALLQLYARLPVPIYGTLAILILAYVTRFLPWGIRFSEAGFMSIHKELEEAGRVSGASTFQIGRRILGPLLVAPIAAGWTYVFFITARELETSVFLVTPDTPVIATLLLSVSDDGGKSQLATLSMFVVLTFGALGFLVHTITRRRGVNHVR